VRSICLANMSLFAAFEAIRPGSTPLVMIQWSARTDASAASLAPTMAPQSCVIATVFLPS
jgi:hypothetical protein